jgi:adenylate cyclase
MAQEKFKRKLTTIFSANVAGYSRLMGEDEAATVKTLEQYKQIMSELMRQHRGRVVDSPGDNLLAKFASMVDAVQCAVATQKELQARNAELAHRPWWASAHGATEQQRSVNLESRLLNPYRFGLSI